MSQPLRPQVKPQGTPAVRSVPSVNIDGIFSNLPRLIDRARLGQLLPAQISPLRSLISTNCKDIIIFHARLGRENPLDLTKLPPILDPSKGFDNYPVLISEAAFQKMITDSQCAASSVKPDPVLIAAHPEKPAAVTRPVTPASGSSAASTPTVTSSSQKIGQPVHPTPGGSSNVPNKTAQQNIAHPVPPMSIEMVKDLIGLTNDKRNALLNADPALKERFVKSYQFYVHKTNQAKSAQATPPAALTPKSTPPPPQPQVPPVSMPVMTPTVPLIPIAAQPSNVTNTVNVPSITNGRPPKALPLPPAAPPIKPEPQYSFPPRQISPVRPSPAPTISTYPSATNSVAASSTPPASVVPLAPSAVHIPSLAPMPSPAPVPTYPTTSTTAAGTATAAIVQVPLPNTNPSVEVMPAPRPIPPPESESSRRKRKLRQYMHELAPRLDLEYGVDDIFSDIIDKFVDQVVTDSSRLAKHRRGDKVEVKDVAFILEKYHNIVVPGFNTQVPKRVHVEPEGDRKRSRTIAPRRAGRRDDD